MDILFVLMGLVILLLAGDALVRGAVNLGLRAGIPAMIVSLTVVAFGTSAPELLIAIKAALEGSPGIAFGNVVGSNTANVLLVLGLPALLAGINSSQCNSAKNYLTMVGVSVVFVALCFAGPLGPVHGVILLVMLAAVLAESVVSVRRSRAADEALEGADETMGLPKILILVGLGLIGLPLGADLLVDGAIHMARHFGLSEAAIGLSIIAVGTSLPELATTVMAAYRRHADVAFGNVIGSNMFNLAAIMGITSFFGPLTVPPEMLSLDLWVMLAATLVLAPFVFLRRDLGRVAGLGLTLAYAAYMVFLLA
jgi:cation:H+ antiporter